MIIDKNYKILGNNISPIYIVIKIISQNMLAIPNKKKILNKATDYENIDIPLLILQIKFTITSSNNFILNIIIQNQKLIIKILKKKNYNMQKY